MKKAKLWVTFVVVILSMPAWAQQPEQEKPEKPVRERVEAMKIGFLTKRLDLTPEEAKAFWPVYNKFSDELEALRKSHRESIAAARENFDEKSDKEVEKLVDNEIAFRQSELDILKKYHPQFKQILPIKKVAKLYRAEEEFKRKLLEMLQEKKENKNKFH
jgi:hypothetical protein